jgi:hypothetical protein
MSSTACTSAQIAPIVNRRTIGINLLALDAILHARSRPFTRSKEKHFKRPLAQYIN